METLDGRTHNRSVHIHIGFELHLQVVDGGLDDTGIRVIMRVLRIGFWVEGQFDGQGR